jgi:signal transduction histidine kinase
MSLKTKKAHFRVSGKITKLLGRESVSESIVALFEVLKNSHDADALSVTVRFQDILSGKGRIIISENGGDGMMIEDIFNKFFVIGSYSKHPGDQIYLETKRYKRKILGSKGVGRFALDRLGSISKIVSKPIESNDKFTFTIDWDKYEPQEVYIEDIGIDVISEKRTKTDDSGLEIEISGLRDRWNLDTIRSLELKIKRLILPRELQPPNAFNIILDAPEFGYNNRPMSVGLAKKAYYTLKAKLFEDRIKVSAKIKDKYVISANEKNDLITEFVPYHPSVNLNEEEKITGHKQVKNLTCGPASLIVYYFPRFQPGTKGKKDAINYYGEAFSNLLDTELPKNSGVRIFRDGLRAFTYGDPDRDWVERSSISRSLSHSVQANRLMGYVLISNQYNSQIKETTNRETAIEDQAFADLREFVIQSMLLFDKYLNRKLKKDEKSSVKQDKETLNLLKHAKKILTDPKSRISKVQEEFAGVDQFDISTEIDDLSRAYEQATKRFTETIKEKQAVMTASQIEIALASVGYIVSLMIHETNSAITTTMLEVNKLRRHAIGEKKRSEHELNQIYLNLFKSVRTIDAWNNFVDRFTTGLTISDPTSRQEEILSPYSITDAFINDIKVIFRVPDLQIDNEINPNLRIRMFSAFYESIVGNLISNSIKSILSTGDKSRLQKVTIRSESSEQYLKIYFSDNGPGIPKESWETVFDPHISSTSKGILKGHGLGLPIVRSIVRYYDGEIKIIEPFHGRGTTFLIEFPWKSISPKISDKK